MKRQTFVFFVYLLLISSAIFSQNSYISDGSNGSGLNLVVGHSASDMVALKGSTAFSIGGVLDIGLGFGNSFTQRFSDDAIDTSLGLVYNILPAQYRFSIIEAKVNVLGSYDYLVVESDYIDSIQGTMEGQGYSIAVEGLVDIYPIELLSLRLGYHAGYASYLLNTTGTDSASSPPITINRRERERISETGYIAGLALRLPDIPIIAYDAMILSSSRFSNYIQHRISLVFKAE